VIEANMLFDAVLFDKNHVIARKQTAFGVGIEKRLRFTKKKDPSLST
jgi:hypothetical protein